jgi:hypothetical protein
MSRQYNGIGHGRHNDDGRGGNDPTAPDSVP